MKRRALIHVENTEGILELADYLTSAGWTVISADKTEELLKKQKIPVIHEQALSDSNLYLAESSKLMSQILSTRYNSDEAYSQDSDENNIFLICMNMIPQFTVPETGLPAEGNIRPKYFFISSILRNAFSNYENVLILSDPADYKEAIIQLKTGEITKEFRSYLAGKALNLISAYDGGISTSILNNAGMKSLFINYITYPFKKDIQLSKGTNKHQHAYLYKLATNVSSINSFHKLQGKELSYVEISDAYYAWEQISTLYTVLKNQFKVKSTNADGYDFVTQFTPLTGTVFTIAVKFNSIVGAALSTNVLDSFKKTCSYDSDSIDGIVFACSAVIDETAAQELLKYKAAAVVAPSFTPEAKAVFAQNKNIRPIPTGKIKTLSVEGKFIHGGIVLQNKDTVLFDHWKVKTKNRPSQIIADEMAFGMMLAMRSRSYSAVLLKDNVIVGIAQGCTSVNKAIDGIVYEALKYASKNNVSEGTPLGDVLISDAELVFNESLKRLIDSGISAIIQTGGSSTDNELIEYCDEKGIVMVFTEMTHISF